MGGEAFWDAAYRCAFPNLVTHARCDGDTESQRMGIDRLLFLSNGQELRIDEKKRERDYGDFLIEYLSNDRTRAPGWIEKDLFIDYLAYAFVPSQKVYLFPWPLLRRAWHVYGDEWRRLARQNRDGFRQIVAHNQGYRTHAIAVPKKRLYQCINLASVIEVTLPQPLGAQLGLML